MANLADLIIANKAELEEFCSLKGKENKELFIAMSRKLVKKERLFVVTDGKKGAIVAKYDYDRGSMDFILRGFPSVVKSEDIVDLNGAENLLKLAVRLEMTLLVSLLEMLVVRFLNMLKLNLKIRLNFYIGLQLYKKVDKLNLNYKLLFRFFFFLLLEINNISFFSDKLFILYCSLILLLIYIFVFINILVI